MSDKPRQISPIPFEGIKTQLFNFMSFIPKIIKKKKNNLQVIFSSKISNYVFIFINIGRTNFVKYCF